MRGAFLFLILLVMVPFVPRAQATDEGFGTSDTVFTPVHNRIPMTYITSYDRDVSTATWTQSLNYSLSRSRLALNTNGSYSTVDQIGRPGLGAGSGTFLGHLDFRAARNWFVSAEGRFNKASARDIVSESNQRQNRLKVSTQYAATPLRHLGITAVLSSEFQEDHSLALRPPGQGVQRILILTNANGDSIGVDTFFVARDSTLTTGREDGLSGQVDWKPVPQLRVLATAFGTRIRPTTTSYLVGNEIGSPQFEQRIDRTRGSEPNDNLVYRTRFTYQGPRGLSTWITLDRSKTDQSYYDRTALRQELFSVDQRGGSMHVEQPLYRGLILNLDGTVSRFLGQFRFRNNRNSLVTTQSAKTGLIYLAPSGQSRGALEFDIEAHRNSRQQTGNGRNVSRFVQASGAHRVSRRLTVDGLATASLTSFQYVDSLLDQDNARTYANVGAGYQVSNRCSTQVHFSVSRGHNVALDPTRSGDNNVQSTYQMDTSLKLGVTPRINISQVYLLNAVYQIYDFATAESKNVLSRIRRIDTYVSDSLFSFATLQFNHNFLFRDFGSFTRPPGGEERLYHVASHTYVQTVSATLNVKPANGVLLFATQSLSNTRIQSFGPEVVNNRWNLALGASIDRPVGNGSLNGTVQHIGAYDERRLPTDAPNDQDDWIAGVTFVKYF